MYAAAEKNLPIIVPGWEDSTMGNIFASYVIKGDLKASTMKLRMFQLQRLVWMMLPMPAVTTYAMVQQLFPLPVEKVHLWS
jgi:hypothetical protein